MLPTVWYQRCAVSVPDLRHQSPGGSVENIWICVRGLITLITLVGGPPRARRMSPKRNCHKSCIRTVGMRKTGSDSAAFRNIAPFIKPGDVSWPRIRAPTRMQHTRCWEGTDQQSAVWGLGHAQTVCGDSFDEAVAARLTSWSENHSRDPFELGCPRGKDSGHELATDKGLTYCQTSQCG